MSAAVWGAGSLNKVTWDQVLPGGRRVFVVLLAVLSVYGRRLGLLEMGDDAARALGVRLEGSRLVLQWWAWL